MSLPQGQPHQDPPCDAAPARARQTDAGIARGPGIVVAAITAVIVFAIGQQLFPVKHKQPPVPPPAPAPVAEPPPPAPTAAGDAAAIATAPPTAEAGSATEKNADAGGAVAEKSAEKPDEAGEPKKPAKAEKTETAEKADASEKAAGDEATAGPDAKPIDKQRQADKDLAREAWRRNRPDVSVNGSKTAIMVPIRGSIKGAEFKISDKRRKVTVTLPKAVSMITLRVYNLKHPLFKKVWIDQDEANAKPADGSKLRFILSQTLDPQVEITDDFVRVTIRRPESSDESRSEKHGERAEKRERAEKHSASSDDAASSEKD